MVVSARNKKKKTPLLGKWNEVLTVSQNLEPDTKISLRHVPFLKKLASQKNRMEQLQTAVQHAFCNTYVLLLFFLRLGGVVVVRIGRGW